MKATAWFCPLLLTLLSATRLVCTAQRGVAVGTAGTGAGVGVGGVANGYPLDYLDAQVMQVRILYTLHSTLSVTSSQAYHTIATFSSLLTLRFGHRCRIFF